MPAPSIVALEAARQQHLEQWENLVESAELADVYYRPGYARAFEQLEKTRAIALHVRLAKAGFLIPLLLRSNLLAGRSDLTDAVTPYGYGGILQLEGQHPPEPASIGLLLATLRDWCNQQRLTACLLRLHPLTAQQDWFAARSLGKNTILTRRGPTTAVDLAKWDASALMLRGTTKGRASDLRLARKNLQVTCSSESSAAQKQHLQIFHEIYTRRMKALAASPFLFFSMTHFEQLCNALKDKAEIFVAWRNSEPVGAAMFLADKNWAHYHLSATTESGEKYKAATLLVNEGVRWAYDRGCKLLHLGGGLTENDGLTRFKQSFGGANFEYHTLLVVADEMKYHAVRQASNPRWPYVVESR